MKTKINDILIESTAQTPVLVCLLASIMPKWIFEILAVIALSIGVMMWWKYKKKTLGIISIVLALLLAIIAVTSSSQKPSSTATRIAELGEDPLRSFFQFDQRAQEAWDTMNISLFEEIATKSLEESMKQGPGRYSFAYFDNIWHKLEVAKNNGSSRACYNMAFMCANGLGRRRSVKDAVDFCMKAIQMNPSDPYPYILLEDMQVDSTLYPEAYYTLYKWRQKVTDESKKLDKLEEIIKNGDDMEISFRQVLFHDTVSISWKSIDANVDGLRFSALHGDASPFTLYLSAYYSGRNNRDSAVYFYEKFLGADVLCRGITKRQAVLYSVIPDTIINIFSREMNPLLIGLSYIDLVYLSRCAGTIIPGIGTLNNYLFEVARCAAEFKKYFFNIHSDLKYTSEFNTISKDFNHAINILIQNQKAVIYNDKSNKYKYYYVVDIHNASALNNFNTEKTIACYSAYKPSITYLFFNVNDVNHGLDEGFDVLNRITHRFHEQLAQKPY